MRIYGDPNQIVQFMDYTNGCPDNSRYIPNLVPGMLQPLEDISDMDNDDFLSTINTEKLVKQAEESTGSLPTPVSLTPKPLPSEKDLKYFGQPVSSEDMKDVTNKSFSTAMKKKTLWAGHIFDQWKCIRNYKLKVDNTLNYPEIKTNLINKDIDVMCDVLCLFVMEICKQNREEYRRETLYEIVLSIQNYLMMNGRNLKLLEHGAFTKLCNTVDNKMK